MSLASAAAERKAKSAAIQNRIKRLSLPIMERFILFWKSFTILWQHKTVKVYLLKFYNWKNHDVYTIGVYSDVQKIFDLQTEKEFNLSDGEYRIVGFEMDSTKAKTLYTKIVYSTGRIIDWYKNSWLIIEKCYLPLWIYNILLILSNSAFFAKRVRVSENPFTIF